MSFYSIFTPTLQAMKSNPLPLIAAFLLLSFHASSQKDSAYRLLLQSGSFIPQKNIGPGAAQEFNRKALLVDGQSFAIIQFDHIPTSDERQQLLKSGITLLNYIPNNAYTVSIKGMINENILQQTKARAIVELSSEQKMPMPLAKGIIPSWSVKIPGTIDVWISCVKTLSYESVVKE